MVADDFKKELKNLLVKYDALIEATKLDNGNIQLILMVYDTVAFKDNGYRFVEITEDKL